MSATWQFLHRLNSTPVFPFYSWTDKTFLRTTDPGFIHEEFYDNSWEKRHFGGVGLTSIIVSVKTKVVSQRGKKIQIYKNFELFWMKNCCLRYEEFEMLPKSKMFRSLSISALFLLWSQRSLNISKCSPYVWLHHWPLPPPLVFGVTRVCVHRRPLSLQQKKKTRAVGGSTVDSDQGRPAVLSAAWMHEKILCSLRPVCGENKPCSQML